jgi:CHAT domain-containing protein
MPAVYRSLAQAPGKSRALRAAQLELLGALRRGRIRVDTEAGPVSLPEHPFFWAGFVLVGEP